MESKETDRIPDQAKTSGPVEDSKTTAKFDKKHNQKMRVPKAERKFRKAKQEEEEEKKVEADTPLNLADLEALKHKDEKKKGQKLSSILRDDEISEELINSLSEDDKRGENDVRVAIIGNVDSGKSTLVGVLSKGELDDGRGAARQNVFNFTHEAENGRTSSIGQEIMGFTEEGKWVEPERVKATKNQSWSFVTSNSKKLVTFIDLCGHEKYLKTTLFGLVGLLPDYCLIVVGANMGVKRMTREHLVIALALNIPIIVAITKVDIAPEEVYEKTKKKLSGILQTKSASKTPIFIEKDDPDLDNIAEQMYDGNVAPIFSISNVTGEGVSEMKSFMSMLKSRIYKTGKFRPPSEPVEFLIDGFYMVTGVGGVIAGTLTSGTVNLGDTLLLGPDNTGKFKEVIVKGIHYKRTPVEECVSGQVCCFNIKPVGKKEQMKRSIFKKGMILIGKDAEPESVWEFVAEITILHNPTTIKNNYQAVIHCGVIRQAAKIVSMSKPHLMMGDKEFVHFRFMYRPEFLKEGAVLMMREGNTKGLGTICSIVRPSADKKK
uniref:Tr-type G domain-containing protein n=1 Tax=Euplotes crassus TaxID=5936 RepID=A0A7S3KR74_EUPCR|mmetsp:Transcript_432/g.409  ORF Transcript_432/g.409 Transcript_432/m.409 type:complete len:547 (+) Transcript_432:17-1657(+)|eukprot:CAMPEP_0197007648 /NCGR_PEP_ID=MMETSP1380-20130617/41659_1 /TAXON_ID=5936 /ORGANISM="Euplotes crassus, Strain CT5" /LENGTH=546 /DNA_ID=CAMNT_0042427863 /DNA_START=15 /DNA_END=1655 /DNA_ORIENTATION=-